MIISPGQWFGAMILTVLFLLGAAPDSWWFWLVGVIIAASTDRVLGIGSVRVLDLPTKSRYVQKK